MTRPHEIENVLANDDETILSYKGVNFYKACNEFVANLPGDVLSYCVKRKDHPDFLHEDFEGHVRDGKIQLKWQEYDRGRQIHNHSETH